MNKAIINLVGQRFGRIYVSSFSHSKNAAFWNCLCDCGQTSVVRGALLRDGTVKSCGCGSIEQARANAKAHAISKRSKYWQNYRRLKDIRRNMLDRCYNPSNKRWKNYGGRGITVCEEWRHSAHAFYEWVMTHGWRIGLTIDRIDTNGNYEPSNCHFADAITQMNNTTRNNYVEWDGKKLTVAQWARVIGVRGQALQHRFTRGWSIERAMTQPFRGRHAA